MLAYQGDTDPAVVTIEFQPGQTPTEAEDALVAQEDRLVGHLTLTKPPGGGFAQASCPERMGGGLRPLARGTSGPRETHSTTSDGTKQYAYDARGRMVQSVGPLGTTAYRVNALGQRVRKSNATDDRVFLYDTRGRLIAETTPSGQPLREYLYLNDIPLAVIQ